MKIAELEVKASEILNSINEINEITPEIIKQIENTLPLYSQFYLEYDIATGQFLTKNHSALFMSYIKVFTVPILITNVSGVVANASGVLLSLSKNILVTNYHVYDEWRKQQRNEETLFQIGSISLPVEEIILDCNTSLDLVTLEISDEIINKVCQTSYKKLFIPQKWPVNSEVDEVVVASGFPGKLRSDSTGFSNLYLGTIAEPITDATESKYIIPFDRTTWEKVLGVQDVNSLTSLGGFSGGPVFSNKNNEINLSGIIFEDGGNFFYGIRVIRSSLINRDGTINTTWGY
ncbi:hypothetical protein Q75_02795 [Bacillus coahuilensis p1.1.43]|uniref:Serine protease n=1 Tax=Bacillus coahuilensis p1.1.43 TaxID=1150625 RepID=A0A147KBF9_9BACI|nr:trypsin-like peptidase domain-containing protein [Bacillus coahuilensis]KUP08444.1 hypothetical protein Q75_02795 [Bacillus coahuilensis p1.1.43]